MRLTWLILILAAVGYLGAFPFSDVGALKRAALNVSRLGHLEIAHTAESTKDETPVQKSKVNPKSLLSFAGEGSNAELKKKQTKETQGELNVGSTLKSKTGESKLEPKTEKIELSTEHKADKIQKLSVNTEYKIIRPKDHHNFKRVKRDDATTAPAAATESSGDDSTTAAAGMNFAIVPVALTSLIVTVVSSF